MFIAGSILLLVAGICSIIVLIAAFKESVGTGLMSMFIPFYILYFAFAKYASPKKGLIIGSWLGAAVLGGALYGVGVAQAASAGLEQLNTELNSADFGADWEKALEEAAAEAEKEAATE